MSVYLRAKSEVSSITLTSFRWRTGGKGGSFISLPPQNKPLKGPPRLGLSNKHFNKDVYELLNKISNFAPTIRKLVN